VIEVRLYLATDISNSDSDQLKMGRGSSGNLVHLLENTKRAERKEKPIGEELYQWGLRNCCKRLTLHRVAEKAELRYVKDKKITDRAKRVAGQYYCVA
jgi:hypothetical protein